MRFATKTCGSRGHVEINVDVEEPLATSVPWLLEFFEGQIAGGVRFSAGQTIEVGSSLLELREHVGGLEVWEPDFSAMPIRWCRGANSTLRQLLIQRAVCEAMGCEPVFPSIRHAAAVSPQMACVQCLHDVT